jgi:hypothetical protein
VIVSVWAGIKCVGAVYSFTVGAAYTRGFLSVPTDKNIRDCVTTNVAAVPRKVVADIQYTDTN